MPRRGSRFLAGRASNPLAARFREIERAIRRRQRFNTSEVTTIVNNAISGGGGSGGGGSPVNTLIVEDEGVQQGTAERMDFVGGGVTASVVGSTATVEVPCPCECDEQLVLDGGWWQTPDHASLDITGDLDLRVGVAMDDWTPGVTKRLVGKWTDPSDLSYLLMLETNAGVPVTDRLALLHSVDGSTVLFSHATAALPAVDGEVLLVRATLDVNNGAAGFDKKFFYKTTTVANEDADRNSDSGWTQLGSTVTVAGATSIFSGIAVLTAGASSAGTGAIDGVLYGATVKDGIDGTTVADPNFAAEPTGTSSFVDDTGKTWTLEGQSAIPVGCLGETAVYDEGAFQGTVKEFDFVGSDVAAAVVGNRATVTVGGPGYRLVSVTYIAQGTTTYNTPAGIDAVYVECIGAGGGGGGTTTAAASAAVGGGGGGGGYAAVFVEGPAASYTVQVGAGGAAGNTTPGVGGTGTDTTFGSPSICTATGGTGGNGMAAGTAQAVGFGGASGVGTVGDLLLEAAPPSIAVRLSGTLAYSGGGGSAPRGGGGGRARTGAAAGNPGGIYGGGGGGGNVTNGSAAVAGGAGANGRIIVWEYASA